jgi:UDP-2,4-diacetamido-2,4,6-trideoxy-beta-L-altropyranose hydrolase
MRCLSLAEALRERNVDISFVCRRLQGSLIHHIESRGFVVHELQPPLPSDGLAGSRQEPPNPVWLEGSWQVDSEQTIRALATSRTQYDWLVVDHYSLDENWERRMYSCADYILVVDDVADRRHDCTILLDQNSPDRSRYRNLVPERCESLLGPRYALLRPEFREARVKAKKRGKICRIVVSFGGIDASNETAKAIRALQRSAFDSVAVDVVAGSNNPHLHALADLVSNRPKTHLHVQTERMAELLVRADLAIGSSGSTSWERCCVGLPCIALVTAPNQRRIGQELQELDCAIVLGEADHVQSADIGAAVEKLLANPSRVEELSERATEIVDGRGAERVCSRMLVERFDEVQRCNQ